MNTNVRKLTDGAMMTAIIGVLLMIDRQTAGTLSSMFLFLIPLPMVFYSVKYGMRDSWMVLAAMVLLAGILGTPQTLFYVASEALIGLIYGSSVNAGVDNRRLLLRTLVPAALIEVAAMLVFAAFFGFDPAEELSEYKRIINEALGMTGAQLPSSLNLENYLRTILVLSVIMTGILEGLITHLVSKFMLKRLRMKVPKSQPIQMYFPPKWTGYVAMAGMMMYFYAAFRTVENETLEMFMQGFGIAGNMYLVVFGLIAIVSILRLRYTGLARFSVLLAVLLFMFSPWAVAITGFLYITTNIHQTLMQGVNSNASEDR